MAADVYVGPTGYGHRGRTIAIFFLLAQEVVIMSLSALFIVILFAVVADEVRKLTDRTSKRPRT
jgi:hypothetical protein